MSESKALLQGKRGLVMGVANDRSIAWGISKAVVDHGAQLALTYQGEALEKRVRPLAAQLGSDFLVSADVTDPASLDKAFDEIAKRWGKLDFIVHAIAYSDKDQLKGKYVDTTRENFLNSMDISVFSFTDVARRARPLMKEGGSMLTLSYIGAERIIPHYNVMGVAKAALEASVRALAADLGPENIRVNAISAGPIRTLAASGIGDFRYIQKWNELNAPLRRGTTIEDVGGSALYLLSELGSGVTGEVLHVDSGYHVVGMMATESAGELSDLLAGFKNKGA